jgi:hypothetical protein
MITSYNFTLASYEFLKGATVVDTFFLPDSFLLTPSGGDATGVLISEDNGHHTRFLSNPELLAMGFATVALFTAQFDADKLSVIPANAANPAGAANYVQFSDGANFAGSIDFQWDDTAKEQTIGNGTNSFTIRTVGGGGTSSNLAIGTDALDVAEAGAANNVGIGHSAGIGVTTGDANVFIGLYSGYNVSTASFNIALGNHAFEGGAAITGESNIAIGDRALESAEGGLLRNVVIGNDAGSGGTFASATDNVIIGTNTGSSIVSGDHNVNIGTGAGYSNTTGVRNVCIGKAAGKYSVTAFDNISIGYYAGAGAALTGGYNVFMGVKSGYNAAGASEHNIAIGYYAGKSISGGSFNVFMGWSAGIANAAGTNNVAIGWYAGGSNVTGNKNVFIGYGAGGSETTSNKLHIANDSSSSLIYGDFATGITTLNSTLVIAAQTAAAAAALTPAEGMIVNVSTTDATFLTTGLWKYQGAAWSAI